MWELILAGRYMMIPIALCSLIGLAVVLERMLVLRKRRVERAGVADLSQDPAVGAEVVEEVDAVRAGMDGVADRLAVADGEGAQEDDAIEWRKEVPRLLLSARDLLSDANSVNR